MKKYSLMLLLLISNGVFALGVNGKASLEVQQVTQSCDSSVLSGSLMASTNGDNMAQSLDHFAYAVRDSRDNVLSYQEASVAAPNSEVEINLPNLFLAGIEARPLTLFVFDKPNDLDTPGVSISTRFEFALNNYANELQQVFDPVEVGLEVCEIVSELFCADPLIYRSGLEALACEVNSTAIAEFTQPLDTVELCIPEGNIIFGDFDLNYCSGSCGNATGCAINLLTADSVNFTESKMCASYLFEVNRFDLSSIFFGNCDLMMSGDYYIGAEWNGMRSGDYQWSYDTPGMELKWFNNDFSNSPLCISNYDSALVFFESIVASYIEDYYSNHFNTNQNTAFCEID